MSEFEAGQNRPSSERGFSGLDSIGSQSSGLAGTLGSNNNSTVPAAFASNAFAPRESSPLANTSHVESKYMSDDPAFSQTKSMNPFGSSADPVSSENVGNQSAALAGSAPRSVDELLKADFTSASTASSQSTNPFTGSDASSGLSFPNTSSSTSATKPSSASGPSADYVGAQSSSTKGTETPEGVVKSGDPVENLVSAIGGILLSAPLAAAEIVTGKAKDGVAVVQQKANEQGLGGVAGSVQAQLSSATQFASDKIQQQRGPDAPPLADTLSAYAQSAASSASAIASSVSQQAQGLVSGAGSSTSATATTDRSATSNLPSTQGIASTVQGYASSAAASISGLATSAATGAQNLVASTGLVSPAQPAASIDGRAFATADTDAPRATLAEGETPTNLSKSEVPSAAGASTTSASASNSLNPDFQSQPGSAEYGQGSLADAPLKQL